MQRRLQHTVINYKSLKNREKAERDKQDLPLETDVLELVDIT
jgi:hypothetical protein